MKLLVFLGLKGNKNELIISRAVEHLKKNFLPSEEDLSPEEDEIPNTCCDESTVGMLM